MSNPSLSVWSQLSNQWVGVGAQNVFSTVKIDNDIFFDASGDSDTLQILGGDNIKVLPNETFTSVVITTQGIGDPTTLTTTNKEVVAAINEIHSDISSISALIDISTLTLNLSYVGEASLEYVADSCVAFDLVYLDSMGYKKSSATTDVNFLPCVAMCLEAGSGSKKLLKRGYITNTSWTWTKGQMLYLSTSSGAITATQPNTTGNVVQIIGYAVDTNKIYFNPQYVWVTI